MFGELRLQGRWEKLEVTGTGQGLILRGSVLANLMSA